MQPRFLATSTAQCARRSRPRLACFGEWKIPRPRPTVPTVLSPRNKISIRPMRHGTSQSWNRCSRRRHCLFDAKYFFHFWRRPCSRMREAFPWDEAPRYVLRDRDAIYGTDFVAMTGAMGMEEVLTAPRSPWQNPFVERLVGSIRRECLDHVIVWNE